MSQNNHIDKLVKLRITEYAGKFIYAFIILNVIVLCCETVKELDPWKNYFEVFEIVSVIVFSIEYGCHVTYAYSKKRVFNYILSPIGIIDLVSILPFYMPMGSIHLTFVKVLRLFRLFRILKIYRYSENIQTVISVLMSKIQYLSAIVLATSVVLFFCAYSTYYFEHDIQPDKFPNIFASIWWGIATLTTIGYGDIYPVTVGGKVMASILALLGIALIAIPAGILSAGFVEMMEKKKKEK